VESAGQNENLLRFSKQVPDRPDGEDHQGMLRVLSLHKTHPVVECGGLLVQGPQRNPIERHMIADKKRPLLRVHQHDPANSIPLVR
jgi:hypothetical protein